MNIFEKIQNIRVELQEMPLKMTGDNKFAGYKYFELDDFIHPLNKLMQKYKLTAIASFSSLLAQLEVINLEDPKETYTIASPFGSAALKGCHEVQNIGAVETYQRRYLYQALFDITEHDALNATQGKPDTKEEKPKKEEPKDVPFDVPQTEPQMTVEEAGNVIAKNKAGEDIPLKDFDDEKLELIVKCGSPRLKKAAETLLLFRAGLKK